MTNVIQFPVRSADVERHLANRQQYTMPAGGAVINQNREAVQSLLPGCAEWCAMKGRDLLETVNGEKL